MKKSIRKNIKKNIKKTQYRKKNRITKKGGAPLEYSPIDTIASEQRVFNVKDLNHNTTEFINLVYTDVSHMTTNQKKEHLKKIADYDCTDCVLKGLSFSQKNLSGVNLNKANLSNSLFNGPNTKLVKALLVGANLEKTEFKDANLTGANLSYTNCEGTNFKSTNLENAIFNNARIVSVIVDLETNLGNVSFVESYIKDFKFSNVNEDTLYNLNFTNSKIVYSNLFDTIFNNFIFTGCTIRTSNLQETAFNDSNFDNANIYNCNCKKAIFTNCNMKYLNNRLEDKKIHDLKTKYEGATFTGTTDLFNAFLVKSNFKKAVFEDTNLTDVMFTGSSFDENTKFIRANMTNTEFTDSTGLDGMNFEGANLKGAIFKGCDVIGANFRRANLHNASFENADVEGADFTDAILINTNFTTCAGLNGMNFEGVNLNGARLNDGDLIGANFRGADLTSTSFEFSNVQGANFEDAIFQDTVLIGVAEGWMEALNIPANARRGRVRDTHLAFNDIQFQELIEFYEKLDIETTSGMDNTELLTFITNKLQGWLADMEDKSDLLIQRLDQCITDRLDTWNYSDTLPGVEPPITWNELIYPTLQYVSRQSKTFQGLYMQIFITDSAEGHGEAFSCIKGVVERLVSTIGGVAKGIGDKNPAKMREYDELENIISPLITMKTLLKEWLRIHGEKGDEPFHEKMPMKKLMDSYKEYCKKAYSYNEKTPSEQALIRKKIMETPIYGVEALPVHLDSTYYFDGGRSRRQKKHSIQKRKTRKTRKT